VGSISGDFFSQTHPVTLTNSNNEEVAILAWHFWSYVAWQTQRQVTYVPFCGNATFLEYVKMTPTWDQGCQIILGPNIPNLEKYNKWPQTIPNGHIPIIPNYYTYVFTCRLV
jgi:hypothetical protein